MKSLYGNDRLVLKKKSNLYYNIEDKNMYDIVNFDYLKNMDMSLNGNIVMNLKNGERVFVSRRYMKEIKTKLKIR